MSGEIWSTTPGERLPITHVACDIYGEKQGRVWLSAEGLPFLHITVGATFLLGGSIDEWEEFAKVLTPALEQARIANRLKDRVARELRQREDRASEDPS